MADPLSIASSIVGLIAVAGKLTRLLSDFVQNTNDAPALVRSILTELLAVNTIFHAVQGMMDSDTGILDESRLSMISVNDLRLALMGCVCVLDTLEREIVGFGSEVIMDENKRLRRIAPTTDMRMGHLSFPTRLRWALKTTTLKGILEDLQRHKLTLNLMLTTINCATNSEALRACEKLKGAVNGIIEANSTTSKQLKFLIARQGPPLDPMSDGALSVVPSVSSALTLPLRAFEAVLKRSRVYRQGHLWGDGMSLGSSVMKRTRWTTMSDLSLSEISKMAVIDLPLWPQDLWNPAYYAEKSGPSSHHSDNQDAIQEVFSLGDANLEIAGQKQLIRAIVDGDLEEVRELLDEGMPLTVTDEIGKGPLHWAAQSGSPEMAQFLIEKGADINARTQLGFTALHCAIHSDDDKIASLLLDYGADIEARDNNDLTPLFACASLNHVKCAKLLVERGANTLVTEKKLRQTPLHMAATYGAKEVAALLLASGVSPKVVDISKWQTPKFYARLAGHKEMWNQLTEELSKREMAAKSPH